ncbi:MAG: type II toxin-antitoxin system VapC family toxin [Candidatus Competibacter sp.]
MKLLLDTHIFLWYIVASPSLNTDTRDLIRDPDHQVYLSPVSLWETLVKHRLGKLSLPEQPEIYLSRQRARHGIDSLALDEASVQRLASLPSYHRDPFDRMLICQALEHDLILVTVDEAILKYPVATR